MPAKAIMIQGTMSGAGKSLLAAGLCRIFAQDGYATAPFKSQNMALNSYICRDGAEIGRAQAMQAECAGIEPARDMNPILLKPTTDVGSQVIVDGRPIGTMPARDYFALKPSLVPRVMEAYGRLAEANDIIVIEGAGSPAEINLKADDIVNMGMARRAKAPVLLVGNIDCGGVFAQLVGTQALLDADERALLKATVINKFRGDATLLDSGVEQLERLMGVPVAGVVPYVDVDVDEEDGFSQAFRRHAESLADIAVVRLPRISNFSDLLALDALEGIQVRYVSSPRELGAPDLIVVPGTKSTIADLRWLRECGLEAAIVRAAGAGTPVLGICGGYQMLGETVEDPQGVEGGGAIRGMGLLPVRTVFSAEKAQCQSHGRVARLGGALSSLSGIPVAGYQIHMGRTSATDAAAKPFCELAGPSGETVGDGCCAGSVYGTYLHGVLDAPGIASGIVSALLKAKGVEGAVAPVDVAAYKERQYDKLARALRASLDMELIYRIVEEGL